MIPKHSFARRLSCVCALAACWSGLLHAQQLSTTLNAIFNQHEYDPKRFGPARWLEQGEKYVTVEPSAAGSEVKNIVEYETATGKRTVLVSAEQLRPPPGAAPMK